MVNPFEHDFGESPVEVDPILEAARNAVFYRDLETAAQTFAIFEAADLILGSFRDGVEIDRERLGRLVDMFDDGPQLDTVYDEDGNLIYYDEEGNEVLREAPAQATYEYFQRKKAHKKVVNDYVELKSPGYIETILAQLSDPNIPQATLSVTIKRGQKRDEVNLNALEQSALNKTRDELRAQGLIVKEDHKSVDVNGESPLSKSQRTHTLHTLTVTKS